MEPEFSVFEVLEIAEEVEHKAAKFYLRVAERFADEQRRNLHYSLAAWRARHERAWARIRREYSDRTGDLGTFDPDDYLLSNPQTMAGLTSFGSDPDSRNVPRGHETEEQIVHDAIRRSQDVSIFYDGLKTFARDTESRIMIDGMISEENRHIRLLLRALTQMQETSGNSAKHPSLFPTTV